MKEDFKEAPDWVDKLITPLNLALEQIYDVLGNLTVGDNVHGKWHNITFTTPAGYTSGDFNQISVPWNIGSAISGVFVGQVSEVSGQYTTITTPVSVSWQQPSASSVQIKYITGLQPDTKYNCRLLIM